jgi:RimJ/RimL family protein N-acetyltransferase
VIPGRLVALRPIEPADLPLLQGITNDVRIQGSVVGWDFPVAGHSQGDWLRSAQANPRTQRLIVHALAEEEAAGLTGLWDIDWHNRSAMTATKLRPESQGRGLGSDAILTTMAWSFYVVGLRRLYSTILDFNEASLSAYVDRCGWRIEGRQREAVFRKGRWCDLYNVAALPSDFQKLGISEEYVHRICPVDVAVETYRKVAP